MLERLWEGPGKGHARFDTLRNRRVRLQKKQYLAEFVMVTIPELKEKYEGLDMQLPSKGEEAIESQCLLTFQYEYPERDTEVVIDTDEFTAVCPWTGLPDTGELVISYVPSHSCIELKSLKFYLLSYRDVGIVQEHAANRILNDLVASCQPRRMRITLDYKIRGGLHTKVAVEHTET